MLKLTRMDEFETAKYHGFTLRKGFWYGTDTETGRYIATSGWECNGCVAVYFKTGNSWDMRWMNVDETEFELRNIPKVNMSNKMTFPQWVEKVFGVTMEYFDSNYNGDQEYDEYLSYLYDGLPAFVRKYQDTCVEACRKESRE